MKNKKGFILSTYIYMLLVFFLLLLGTMLVVLNNTKILSKKLQEESGNASGINSEISFILKGDKEVSLLLNIDNFEEPGFTVTTTKGEDISDKVIINSNVDETKEGNYSIFYTISYNGKTITKERKISVKEAIFDYEYTGDVQEFTAPASGYYKLEVWGASGGVVSGGTNGGAITMAPGYGGYSVGVVHLNKNEIIYINVGGKGTNNCVTSGNGIVATCPGGYNGGGVGFTSDAYRYVSGGGGATHIGTKPGILSTLSTNLEDILIVAGGGGGSTYYNYQSAGAKGYGGSGGGYIGISGKLNSTVSGAGGTQTVGSAFGKGEDPATSTSHVGRAGGGGGYYGGISGPSKYGAGGGSGYIANNSLLTYSNITKMMYCYGCSESTAASTYTVNTIGTSTLKDATACPNGYSNNPVSKCAKSGDGYAKITYLGPQEY